MEREKGCVCDTVWCRDLPPWLCSEVTVWLMEKARLCELDWFHIQPSIPLQMWPAVLGGGRTGFVMLPLPGSETFVHFLQIPSA